MIKTIFKTQWGWSRFIRLTIGLAFLVDAFYKQSGIVATMGLLLIYQALFNMGCALNCVSKEPKKDHPFDLSKNFKKLNK
ncbi:MAG: hypothetical protein ACPGRC_07340 [Salibacteraceae bacterium]